MVYNSHIGEDVKMMGEERANPQLLEKGCWKEFNYHTEVKLPIGNIFIVWWWKIVDGFGFS